MIRPIPITDFDNLFNAIWCAIVTMTTVGYGDFYPKTTFGRIVGVFLCFWGVFLVSLFVITLGNLLNFDDGEKKVNFY